MEAVNELHKKNLTHGNLKLSNIFFKEVAPDKSIAIVTNLSGIKSIGEQLQILPIIPIQMQPPEVLQGQPYTPQSDLYMIGLIMYGMLFGKLPYTSDNPQALLQEQYNGPQELDKVSSGFNTALCTLLAFDPNQRTSCEQMLQQCPIFFRPIDNSRIYNRGYTTIPTHILTQTNELQHPLFKSWIIPGGKVQMPTIQPLFQPPLTQQTFDYQDLDDMNQFHDRCIICGELIQYSKLYNHIRTQHPGYPQDHNSALQLPPQIQQQQFIQQPLVVGYQQNP
ncbi:MAG: hypothetical protein EZS28_048991, partial [Streblomastix strix]